MRSRRATIFPGWTECGGGEWLGGRDSNPDYTVQSRVSYH